MEAHVFALVLVAAALHAGWNAVVKLGLDRLLAITLIAGSAGLVALLALPFAPVPDPAAWPWLLTSIVLHVGYNVCLVQAYRTGDFGQVYPIARGTAPLIVTLVAVFLLAETLTPAALLGIALLVGGVWLMSLRGGRDLARMDRSALGFALLTSAFIAGYTLTDGQGARVAGSAHGYTMWLFALDGLAMVLLLLALRGRHAFAVLRPHWKTGLGGGAMSLGAYWIAIWAMTEAPIALVAALRESSVLFAAAISVVILREPLTRWRAAAALSIVAGVVMMRLG
ncbi:EamA family transporter [Halovulum dunhuangense]|uniref:EamA family transporter n=1 Tax=Halovulum dunhuangense TaxID=1505036 RepID=A0A849L648_9RHOB|nr:EamA family transporter [Halovulum dunhuangense]NNU81889.1 EamA family transporter [Halovulum dunhuangense]